MALELPVASPWWEHDAHLLRFLCDFIDGELSVLRRCRVDTRLPWNGALLIGRDFGADSLEVRALATAFSEMLHLHRSGIDARMIWPKPCRPQAWANWFKRTVVPRPAAWGGASVPLRLFKLFPTGDGWLTPPQCSSVRCPAAHARVMRSRMSLNGSTPTPFGLWVGSTRRCRSAASMCSRPK